MFDVILQVGFFPSMPLLATLLIAIDVVVLFALTARWDEAQAGRHGVTPPRRLRRVAGSDALLLEHRRARGARSPARTRCCSPSAARPSSTSSDYYAAIAEPLMRAMGGRPVLMQRFPKGAGGPSFFQKRVPDSAPEWLETTTVQTVNGTPSRALVAADAAHVAWAVNLACLGFHVWPNRADDPDARRRAAPRPRPAARHRLRRRRARPPGS